MLIGATAIELVVKEDWDSREANIEMLFPQMSECHQLIRTCVNPKHGEISTLGGGF